MTRLDAIEYFKKYAPSAKSTKQMVEDAVSIFYRDRREAVRYAKALEDNPVVFYTGNKDIGDCVLYLGKQNLLIPEAIYDEWVKKGKHCITSGPMPVIDLIKKGIGFTITRIVEDD